MFTNLYSLLYAYYGNLKWWPSETDDETVIGCILTQNTSWKNVEKAIEKMKSEHIDTLIEITRTDNEKLKDLIRSSGFYNQKSRYLSAVARAIIEKYGNLDKNIESTMNIIYAVKDLNRDIHIVKLGSMGEYGTPNIDIPEGFLNLSYNGRNDTLPFPRMGQSWYHLSKIFDTYNLMLANRIWDLNVSDVMQGVVYGTRTEEITKYKLFTRFDIDQVYGTVLNRFISQAVIGYPLTVYGKGDQKRAFLSLQDSVECLNLILDHPAEREYKVYNQFDEYYPLNYIAETVKSQYETIYGKSISIDHVPNPRVEMEDHYYNPVNQNLKDIGYRRQMSLDEEMPVMISDVRKNINMVYGLKNVIKPSTNWR